MTSAEPDLESIARSGVAALRGGDAAAARRAFEQVVAAGQAGPQTWLLLAQACERLDDVAAAQTALDGVLASDKRNIYALVMRGDLLARGGDDRAAIAWYEAALSVAGASASVAPGLKPLLDRAERARDAMAARFTDHMHRRLTAAGVDTQALDPRFGEAIDILSGTKQPYFQSPTSFFYPRLPHIAFYEREDFPWLAAIEAAAPAIRAEAESVLREDAGITPYVEREANRPSREHSLLGDARWGAFHLWKDGELVPENAARCPRTVAALAGAPIPHIRGRSPMTLFSILKAGTHIPPHSGMLNTRLICHIPLIVPPDCALRVGNETRTVEEGKALIFDDSVEHEAWNNSDQPRAILLFEIWRPELSDGERAALTAMFEAITEYPAGPAA